MPEQFRSSSNLRQVLYFHQQQRKALKTTQSYQTTVLLSTNSEVGHQRCNQNLQIVNGSYLIQSQNSLKIRADESERGCFAVCHGLPARRFSGTTTSSLQDVWIKTNIFVLVIRLQDLFKTFSRRLQDVLSRPLQNVFKTSSRHLKDVLQRCLQDLFKT